MWLLLCKVVCHGTSEWKQFVSLFHSSSLSSISKLSASDPVLHAKLPDKMMIMPDISGMQSEMFSSDFHLQVALKACDPCASRSETTRWKTPKCTNDAC